MLRVLAVLVVAYAGLSVPVRADVTSNDELKKKPIATDADEVGKLLEKGHEVV